MNEFAKLYQGCSPFASYSVLRSDPSELVSSKLSFQIIVVPLTVGVPQLPKATKQKKNKTRNAVAGDDILSNPCQITEDIADVDFPCKKCNDVTTCMIKYLQINPVKTSMSFAQTLAIKKTLDVTRFLRILQLGSEPFPGFAGSTFKQIASIPSWPLQIIQAERLQSESRTPKIICKCRYRLQPLKKKGWRKYIYSRGRFWATKPRLITLNFSTSEDRDVTQTSLIRSCPIIVLCFSLSEFISMETKLLLNKILTR